jgi:uncharacterized membrane-anchored protein
LRTRLAVWGFAGAFALQAALLAWLIADRALLLSRGAEVRLAVVPVDPRDFFRGDYVVLSYEISQLRADSLAGDDDFSAGDAIYVSMHPKGDGWEALSIHHAHPGGGTVMRGRVAWESATPGPAPTTSVYQVNYGLEEFFIPEGRGVELEELRNDQRLQVDVSLSENGRAALKRLLVDGEVRYEESLW